MQNIMRKNVSTYMHTFMEIYSQVAGMDVVDTAAGYCFLRHLQHLMVYQSPGMDDSHKGQCSPANKY